MSTNNRIVSAELSAYLEVLSREETTLLRQLRAETALLPNAVYQINPLQGELIRLLLHLIRAEKALEIGVYTGYSSLCIALALPAQGRLIACDINAEWTARASHYWQAAGVADKVELRLAPALQTLTALLDNGEAESFDFIFIDADKESYAAYYELSLQLLRPGGLLMVDNVLWKGYVFDPTNNDPTTLAIRAFNRQLQADRRIEFSMLPIADGVTLARKLSAAEMAD